MCKIDHGVMFECFDQNKVVIEGKQSLMVFRGIFNLINGGKEEKRTF